MITLLQGDARDILPTLPEQSVQMCVTSPPYFGLRDYGVAGQIGLESTVAEYIAELVHVFDLVWRVLRDDGTLWINMGDAYANDTKWGGQTSGKHVQALHGDSGIGRRRHQTGLRSKSLMGLPWRLAFALQDAGWILRCDIIWHKPNGMCESVEDRPTRSHEYLFLLAKAPRYYYDAAAIAEPTTTTERPQYRRAIDLARAAGITPEHISAIRAAGITDTGKTAATQAGTGHNTEDVRRFAAEAKQVLGGYYREFLLAETRNRRSVWTIPTQPLRDEHYAAFPEALVEPCILAGSRPGDTVLDPFVGSGTVARVAERLQRHSIGIDLAYQDLQQRRTDGVQVMMTEVL